MGAKDPKTLKVRKRLSDEFMELKLAPRMFEALIGNLRNQVNQIRQLEKEIMIIAVRDAGMPRKEFILSFPKNETSQPLAAEADQGRQEVVERASAACRTKSRAARTSWRRSRRNITSRSRTSKRSTVKCRSAKRRPAARRRKWSRPTCAS